MADQDMLTPGNGSGDPNTGPQAATLAQYIKDLSIENPNAPHVFQWQDQPRVDVQFNINVDRVSDDVHEVVIKLDVSARSDSGVQFMIELSYGGLFGLRNFPEEALGPFLLVEAPRLLFPFARQIIAESTQNAGFPPLLLDGIDFGAAYLAQLQAAQQAEANGGGEANGASEDSPPSSDEDDQA
jgi:preprotein translocase subunit SecB